jgi:predicted CoA-substrate-specific enzyme activase
MKKINIGFDIGSVSINTIICHSSKQIIEELPYTRHFGRTLELCAEILKNIEDKYGKSNIGLVAFTGTHGKSIAKDLNSFYLVETIAQTIGLYQMLPKSRSVISIGGHDSALLILEPMENAFNLVDFKLNEACAAGTGSFIDQQAERIFTDLPSLAEGLTPQNRIEAILSHFIQEGLKSDTPANVACRCTVFTKSDMIHLQNKGIPTKHIIAGLHEGVARNYKSTLITNRILKGPVAFIGGYATNRLAIKAFEKILGCEIIVPQYHASLGALGTVFSAIEQKLGKSLSHGDLLNLKNNELYKAPRTTPLELIKSNFTLSSPITYQELPKQALMGIDVGSTTTKLVLIDENGKIIYKNYLPTEGQPLVAIKKAMTHCMSTIDTKAIEVIGVGTTGSGREVAGIFTGADHVVNEVTAHAIGTTHYDKNIDTIFELGGQDAKYTFLKNGQIVDFKMNKVCAAGTGSFLEETANKLGISINKEYEELAMSSEQPFKLTERCTVYMESDLMSYLQNGATIPDLLAGLSIAIVHNYLNRVVQDGKIGNRISFQGGPSLNKSVVAAFEKITNKTIVTLPDREVLGAVGAALQAHKIIKSNNLDNYKSTFRGWTIINQEFSHKEEICERNPNCHNKCKLQIFNIGDEEAVFGGDCGMYESNKILKNKTPDYAKIRNLVYKKYFPKTNLNPNKHKIKIGIPRALTFHQLGLLWVTMLDELGFHTIVSAETDNDTVNQGINSMTCEACFPIKISHGHTLALKDKCDFLFLPLMIEMESDKENYSFYCPYVEANTYMLKSALNLDTTKLLKPAIYLKQDKASILQAIASEFLRVGIKISNKKLEAAYNKGAQALNTFNQELKAMGQKVMQKIQNEKAIVVLSRPYNLYDPRTNLNLFNFLSKLGIHAIPQDFLDFEEHEISDKYPNMYWGFGNIILKASQLIKQQTNLFGLYLTSFSCGPDSFILHFFNEEMGSSQKPFLELELDEHSAGAGVETRLLAFIDTINNYKKEEKNEASNKEVELPCTNLKSRTLYVPDMTAGARCLAACFRSIGIKAKVMPTYTETGLELGKRATSGKECYPCIVTTGDMLDSIHKAQASNIDIENDIAFFMPETEGPCRFGQYNKLQRIILDKHGYNRVPILSPTSEDSYSFNGQLNKDEALSFRKLIWQAIVYSDLIEKALWRIRPYEKVKGTTDRVFEKVMRLGVLAIERGGGVEIIQAAKKAAQLFSRIETRATQKPLIGIVGEIFVRTHKGSNQQLVKQLEDLGCETLVASVSEWVAYTTHTGIEQAQLSLKKAISGKNLSEALSCWTSAKYQDIIYKTMSLPFQKTLKNRLDHSTTAILKEVGETFSNHINGEAILSIGGAIAFAKSGFNGVVNAMPFTCMPSTIASSILKSEMRNKVPYIDMVYDGSIQPNRELNLETFVYQAKQHMNRNKN